MQNIHKLIIPKAHFSFLKIANKLSNKEDRKDRKYYNSSNIVKLPY